MVYSQLVQSYTCNADMKKSLEYIKKAKSIDTKALGIELETLLLKGGAESKYYLLQGNYEMKSLTCCRYIHISQHGCMSWRKKILNCRFPALHANFSPPYN